MLLKWRKKIGDVAIKRDLQKFGGQCSRLRQSIAVFSSLFYWRQQSDLQCFAEHVCSRAPNECTRVDLEA